MAVHPIATLYSISGEMQFYDIAAVTVWADREKSLISERTLQAPQLQVQEVRPAHAERHGVPRMSWLPQVPQLTVHEVVSPVPPPPCSELYEGYNAQQWAEHAKRKSQIASNVCRINGELKARLAAGDVVPGASAEKMTTQEVVVPVVGGASERLPVQEIVMPVDPFTYFDPWLNAATTATKSAMVKPRADTDTAEADAWLSWKKVKVQTVEKIVQSAASAQEDKLSGYFTELQRNIASHVFAVELHRELCLHDLLLPPVLPRCVSFDNECAPVYSSDSCSESEDNHDYDSDGFICMHCGTTYERFLPNCLKCGQRSTLR